MLYLIATALMLLAAGFVAASLPVRGQALDRALAWFLLVPAFITGTTLLLGLAGFLTPGSLLGSSAALAIAALALWIRRRGRGFAAGPSDHPFRLMPLLRQPWLWPPALAGAAITGWLLCVGLRVPPYAWDGLSYHLPPAVWWLQAGQIYPPPTQFVFGYGYPLGMSLLLLWQLAFTATDHLVNLVQLPFLLMGMAAAYGLAREVGIGRGWAAWGPLFWGLTPLVLEQMTVPYNDVAVSALTLAALYFTFRSWRTSQERKGHLWLAGLAVGLILGIKPNGFLVLGLVGLLALLPRCRPWRRYLQALSRRALALGLPPLLLAGYWYIRNLVLYHNPLYPLAIAIGGRTLFPGPRKTVASLISVTPDQAPWQSFRLALKEWAAWYSYDTPNAGFGPVFTCLGVAAILAAGLHAISQKRWRLVALLGAGLLLFLAQPFKYPRYILHLPAVAGICFAYVLQRLAGRGLRHLLQAAAVGLIGYALLLVPYQPQLSAETLWQVRTAAAEGRSIPADQFGLARHYEWVERVPGLLHPDNRIAFTEFGFVYPLMGPDRSNQVYHISPYPAGTYEQWLEGLLQARTTFLVSGYKNAVENRWARAHPERFIPWAEGFTYAVYLVRSDEPRNQLLLKGLQSGGDRP